MHVDTDLLNMSVKMTILGMLGWCTVLHWTYTEADKALGGCSAALLCCQPVLLQITTWLTASYHMWQKQYHGCVKTDHIGSVILHSKRFRQGHGLIGTVIKECSDALLVAITSTAPFAFMRGSAHATRVNRILSIVCLSVVLQG